VRAAYFVLLKNARLPAARQHVCLIFLWGIFQQTIGFFTLLTKSAGHVRSGWLAAFLGILLFVGAEEIYSLLTTDFPLLRPCAAAPFV
jgi:hypothetical protein